MDTPVATESSSAPLDVSSAGAALASYFGGDQGQNESAEQPHEKEETTQTAAAEQTGEPDANQAAEGEQQQNEGESYDENETVTVMIDGKPVELTKAQIAEAKKGELRQADYTRKTMEAAEQRKAAEAEKAQAKAQREQYSRDLQQILLVNQFHDQQAQQWTPDMVDADPLGYIKFKMDVENRALQTQQAQAQLQQIQQQEQQEREQSAHEYRAQQLEMIRAKLPAWKDEAVMKREIGEIKEWLHGQEFTDADLSGMQDHRMVLLAQKAMKYEQLMAKAKTTAQQVAKAPPKVEPPGRQPVAPTDGRTEGMKRLAKTGKVDDAAAILAQMFSK